MTSKAFRVKLISVTGIILLIMLFWTKFDRRHFDRTLFVVGSRSYENVPQVKLDILKLESDSFSELLKLKLSELYTSRTQQENGELTLEEKEQFRICVENGQRDRDQNGSKFWPNQDIRRNHHTYLSKDSVMMEVGGNRGDDAVAFTRLFNPRHIILEPLEEYANFMKEKFKDNPRVTVVNLGLGSKNEIIYVKTEGNNACATSKFSPQGDTPLFITNATEFLLRIGLGLFEIDLLTMNCEGCEFETLESILLTHLVQHLRNIQFGTHSTILGLKDPIQRYCKIQQLLLRSHRPTYQYKFIWESWRRRDLK